MSDLARSRTPDDEEIAKRQAHLNRLEARLAQKELDLATLQAELHSFETRYIRSVGILYWELDEVNAQIAEAMARLHPEKVEVQYKAAKARARAQETAETVGEAKARTQDRQEREFKPSDELKILYRDLAKRIHPDLAADDADLDIRNKLMSEANRAYEDGDIDRLRSILEEWKTSPEAVSGESIEERLERLSRKIERVKLRLEAIRLEAEELIDSELYRLMRKVQKASEMGRDLLSEMTARVRDSIVGARRRLEKAKKRLPDDEQAS